MKRKAFLQAGMVLSIAGMLGVLILLGACSGLIDGSAEADDGKIAAAMKEYGAVVRIPIGDIAGRAATASTDIGLFNSADLAKNKQYVTYYEAIFKQGSGATATYYSGSANIGESYLTVGISPGGPYEVLVLAGTPANNDLANGEKVLLASGFRDNITITANTVNRIEVKMYGIGVKMGVTGIKKGVVDTPVNLLPLPATGPASAVLEDIPINTSDKAMRYVQLERANSNAGSYSVYHNPWWLPAASFKTLDIQLKLEQLTPLVKAFNTAVPTGSGSLVGTGKLFNAESVQITTVSYSRYAMEPISFDPADVGAGITVPTGPIDETGFPIGALSPLTLNYTILSYIAAVGPTPEKINVPDHDAAGNFHFNFRYNPYSLEMPPANSSTWNVRNRILWDGEGYYGGGVVFLFGNAALTDVIVIPTY
ncbi:MAG: hypothetical protein LBG87_00920 [Spirochaetaceae bacterium]|jgi:hypothetical protein|nr:hypothetical protein [Spirochaetaceae bacterium]